MGIITKEVDVVLRNMDIKYYEELGYDVHRRINKYNKNVVMRGTKIRVNVEDLPNNSFCRILVKCDKCEKTIDMSFSNYNKYVNADGTYNCNTCIVSKGISFTDWCLKNKKELTLNCWDYDLNILKPNEIPFKTNKKYWFKCPNGIHESELYTISNISSMRNNGMILCSKCNSFAQYNINNIGIDFLEKYWDHSKNNKNPWKIRPLSETRVYIKCQEKGYHGSYEISCAHFSSGNRCSYCGNKKLHKLDSLGELFPESIGVWSDKNEKSPYEYSPKGSNKVWWKCPNGKHDDFYRKINNSFYANFRCPKCNFSKGEDKVSKWIIKNNIFYESQKSFDGLLGVKNRLLSYDFYLPDHNLLIEYQGEQHEKYIKGFHKSEEEFKKQQHHDELKRQYAKDNNINLLEIWYWDYDNIETVLDSLELNNNRPRLDNPQNLWYNKTLQKRKEPRIMTNRYIADYHFGHKNVIKFDNRPFENIEAMEAVMVYNWNSVVENDDTTYILGDFCWGKELDWIRILDSLNGNKVLILGNHDIKEMSATLRRKFIDVKPYKEITDNQKHVILSHYPIMFYKGAYNPNCYMLCGHVHVTKENDFLLSWKKILQDAKLDRGDNCGQIYNVGCMMPYINYTPRTLSEIIGFGL